MGQYNMSTNDIVYPELLFNFGSVLVYELKPKIYDVFHQPAYYWRYKDAATYAGPFRTIMECTRHWESTTRNDKVDISNVIRIDFINKRRIK